MLLNKVRENLDFKQSKGEKFNFLLQNKIVKIKPLLKNKMFFKSFLECMKDFTDWDFEAN